MIEDQDKLKQQNLETQISQMNSGIQQKVDSNKILTNYGSYQVLNNGVKIFSAED
ncbi:hypothetical protein QBE52_06050 [Clostridiaceae bacterium 35-E11]